MKVFSYLFLVLMLVLLFGCEAVTKLGRSEPKTLPIAAIHTGTEGVKMDFVENAPPAEVIEKNKFEIAIEVENKGASDAEGLYVLGIPTDVVTVVSTVPRPSDQFTLTGKTPLSPVGELKRFVILAEAKELLEERYPATITANICYKYKTKTSQIVCIKPETALQRGRREICSPAAKSLSGGQGGPVAVVNIEKPVMVPVDDKSVSPVIEMRIQNVGTGTIVNQKRFSEMCTQERATVSEAEIPLINVVNVKTKLSEKQLKCTPKVIKLTEDSTVTCTLEKESIQKAVGTYEALFEVELEYGYVEQKTKRMVIKKII